MNKKSLFNFFVMILVGLFLGYCINLGISTNWGASELPTKDRHSTLRRFGDKITINQTSRIRAEKTKALQLKHEESYFLQLSRMDVEEIQKEIDRIVKKTKSIYRISSFDKLALSFLYSRLGQKAPRQALDEIKKNSKLYAYYGDRILDSWSERNPEAAMNYCLEDKDFKDVYKYADVIARVSPEKALEWIKTLPQMKKNEAMYGFIPAIMKEHPEKIGEIIQQAGVDSDLTTYIAGQWVILDKEAAMKWINSLPEKEQIEARASALRKLPLEETTLAINSLEGKAKEAVIVQVVNSLVEESPLKAIEWLMTYADSDLKSWQNIIDSMYFSRFHFNDPALQAYVTKMPTGDKKDVFMEKMVKGLSSSNSNLVENDMNEVLSLTSLISNVEKRESAMVYALNSWAYKFPNDARQWIEKSELSTEKKTDLYKSCDRYAKERR